MFGKKQKKTIEVTKLSSLIADNLQVVGDVLFSGGLRVDGKVEGNVLGKDGEKSLIVLSDKGCVVGRIHAHDAVINGTVSGDLEVDNFLELQAGARVSGNITYNQLQMECGATVEGKLVCVSDDEKATGKSGETARVLPQEGPPKQSVAPPVLPQRPSFAIPTSPSRPPAIPTQSGTVSASELPQPPSSAVR